MIILTINVAQDIQSIKDEFTLAFPYLKLEFSNPKNMPGSPNKGLFESTISLKEIPKKYHKGYIHITADLPVADLEKQFLEQFGLSVQVFRKSGKTWLETVRTDDWSLKRQNEEGKALSLFIRGL